MRKQLKKTCKGMHVITQEAQQAIWRLAPRDWIGKRKAAIAAVARELGWKFSRTWNIAHGRAHRIDAHEMDQLRHATARLDMLIEQANANRERFNELIFARHEIARAGHAHREGGPGATPVRKEDGTGRGAGAGAGPRSATTPSTRR